MKILRTDELIQLKNGNLEAWVRFEFEGKTIGVVVNLIENDEIILHRDAIQYNDNGNWFDYEYTEKEYDYWHSKLERYYSSR